MGTTQKPLAMSREQYHRYLSKSSSKSLTSVMG
ncbi:hypothetical protein PF005_g28298 [Phytophthora fragariae]|uniref:Uncharacterized protein n=1 Tax=Phytophthora fragariae TaxID=53985 RepID=A0A6A3VJR7_9STRA|nr:hypothetical protein PF009_g29351 [Phytophthora fragariae]KAE9065025.1 hypothetical protein PF010_g28378 [Phytophthora fragariae]KAE9168613.1 hypothetical protein PF005_g28298 [Phytophthora fragariae]